MSSRKYPQFQAERLWAAYGLERLDVRKRSLAQVGVISNENQAKGGDVVRVETEAPTRCRKPPRNSHSLRLRQARLFSTLLMPDFYKALTGDLHWRGLPAGVGLLQRLCWQSRNV